MAEKILVVDDEGEIRHLIRDILEDEGYQVSAAGNGAEAHSQFEKARPQLVLLDIWMPDIDGISVLKAWRDKNVLGAPVIMMSGHGNVETAVEATKLGAYDYLEKPLSTVKLLLTIRNALAAHRLANENQRLKNTRRPPAVMIGGSTRMRALKEQLSRVSAHNTPLLLLGEYGTDKESIARHIHANSERSAGPFVAVNAGALEAAAELADAFAEAGQGIVFVRDIAELAPDIQAWLCDMLDRQSYAGAHEQAQTNDHHDNNHLQRPGARLIAASRKNLNQAVKEGSFLDELLFQLNIVPLKIPMLRERYEDVPLLLEYYAAYFAESEGLPYRQFSTAAQNRLRHYAWPGNVMELRNLVQRLLILSDDETIALDEVETVLGEQPQRSDTERLSNFDLPLRAARERFEKAYLEYQLKQTGGSVSKIARVAGMERTHLYRKLKSLGITLKS